MRIALMLLSRSQSAAIIKKLDAAEGADVAAVAPRLRSDHGLHGRQDAEFSFLSK